MAENLTMSPEEYLSEKRFPLSTQTDPQRLDLNGQVMIDAVNLDSLREGIELGEEMTEEQMGILAEIEEKMRYAPALRKQLAEQDKATNRAQTAAVGKK